MENQVNLDVPFDIGTTSPYDVTSDVHGMKTLFVNLYLLGEPGVGHSWVLVDTGFAGYADAIKKKAEALFGSGTRPEAIVLTHGHADHIGTLKSLLEEWPVPVYAHKLELPYLTGKSSYPPPDPAIGGGLMSYLSWIFPIGPEDFGDRIQAIPEHGLIPELSGWQVIHTPGHAPGHISLFREGDRTLIAGDAFVTTNQNSAVAVAQQKEEINGPPAYFTCDWQAARESVQVLRDLKPAAVGTGHGVAMRGYELEQGLNQLANHFDRHAIPSQGRYVKQAAITDESGVVDMPTPTSFWVARAIGLGIAAGALFYALWPDRDIE